MVPTVSRSQPSAHLPVQAAEGVSACNISLVIISKQKTPRMQRRDHLVPVSPMNQSLTPRTSGDFTFPGLILGLRPASERRRYNVTPSLIGWA